MKQRVQLKRLPPNLFYKSLSCFGGRFLVAWVHRTWYLILEPPWSVMKNVKVILWACTWEWTHGSSIVVGSIYTGERDTTPGRSALSKMNILNVIKSKMPTRRAYNNWVAWNCSPTTGGWTQTGNWDLLVHDKDRNLKNLSVIMIKERGYTASLPGAVGPQASNDPPWNSRRDWV